MYKFQGRQLDKNYSECLNYYFFKQSSFNTWFFLQQQITRFEKQNLLKSVFLLNFISINTELQKIYINLIHANKITIPE